MSPTDLAAHYRKLVDKHDRDLYDGDRGAPGLTTRMAEQENEMQAVKRQLSALGFEDGMAHDFVVFKTEILTSIKNTNDGVAASNSRMNVIIAGLLLVVTTGLLLCAILTIALNRKDTRTMLLSDKPVVTASSYASEPDDVQ